MPRSKAALSSRGTGASPVHAVEMRKPRRIILVRHGESAGNVDKGVYSTIPDYALELTPNGVSQAERAGIELGKIIGGETVRFYVSTHRRAEQTYEAILRTLRVPTGTIERTYFDPRLREQDWGHLREASATLQMEEARNRYGAFHFRFEHGESCADVYDRLSTFLDTLHRDWEKDVPQNSVLVTHGRTMRVFLMRWFKMRPQEFERLANPKNCQIIIMENDGHDMFTITTPLERYEA